MASNYNVHSSLLQMGLNDNFFFNVTLVKFVKLNRSSENMPAAAMVLNSILCVR